MSTSPETEPEPARSLIDGPQLRSGVVRLGRQLSDTYRDGVVLVPVLKGSLLFVADLVRQLTIEPTVDFLAITAYAQGTGRIRLVKDLDADIAGRDVVLVEDIVDPGLTLAYLLGDLGRRQPASLQVCTLLDRPARRILPTPVRFVGFEIPDEFVIGYGLDYAGRYRNLDLVAAAEPAVLRADPDAYVKQLYGGGHEQPNA
jgi:hypoxanthine phosphoribosyltransferase